MTFVRSLLVCVLLAAVPVSAFTASSSRSAAPLKCQPLLSATLAAPSTADDHDQVNLYTILGATGTETRQELKQLYRSCAKRLHPDAVAAAATSKSCSSDDFSQVAHAYNILSNPRERRNYDRALLAEQFTQQACQAVERVVEQAAKNVASALDWMNDAMQQQQQQTRNNVQCRRQQQKQKRNPLQMPWMKQIQKQASSTWSDAARKVSSATSSSSRTFRTPSIDWQRLLHTHLAMTATAALVISVQLLSWNDAAATAA
ncbi:hypothetical protein MPSEU_000550300 [Mayamaea pseudoterrestris]|nr:hypothetical protein MPSEU_000550300 [Mayamaea pseudoterrestris]